MEELLKLVKNIRGKNYVDAGSALKQILSNKLEDKLKVMRAEVK